MTVVIAMDADGTVEPSGPVPREMLRRMYRREAIVRIGNTWLEEVLPGIIGPKDEQGFPIPGLAYGKTRWLKEIHAGTAGADEFIVVDDDPSQYIPSVPEPWRLLSPREFIDRFPWYT